jgi:nitrogen regulatory protein PII
MVQTIADAARTGAIGDGKISHQWRERASHRRQRLM